MSAWSKVLEKVKRKLSSLAAEGCDIPFFRGHADSSWQLLPSIRRFKVSENSEEIMYFDFLTQAGSLLPENNSAWVNAFMMQHYGLPTRLLDWTETFSVALYFALKNSKKNAAIWILDPFELNRESTSTIEILRPTDLKTDYRAYFIEKTVPLEGDVIAISPLRHNPRVFNQHAGFTLHDNIETPLEDLHPSVLTKIEINKAAFEDAWTFLELAGINEFTLFPDLDGLARDLKKRHLGITI